MGLFDFLKGNSSKKEERQGNSKSVSKICPRCGFDLSNIRYSVTGEVWNIQCPKCSTDVTNIMKDSFIDLRNADEIRISQIAKGPLNKDDEDIADQLLTLLKRVDGDYCLLSDAKQKIRNIGEDLWKNGGMARMWLLAYRVQNKGGDVRLLELTWDRIGNWLA